MRTFNVISICGSVFEYLSDDHNGFSDTFLKLTPNMGKRKLGVSEFHLFFLIRTLYFVNSSVMLNC